MLLAVIELLPDIFPPNSFVNTSQSASLLERNLCLISPPPTVAGGRGKPPTYCSVSTIRIAGPDIHPVSFATLRVYTQPTYRHPFSQSIDPCWPGPVPLIHPDPESTTVSLQVRVCIGAAGEACVVEEAVRVPAVGLAAVHQ